MTTVQLEIPEDSPAAAKVLEALEAMGVRVEHVDGKIIAPECPAGPCHICAGIHALAQLEDKAALGGKVCPTCLGIARAAWRKAQAAANRQLREFAGQLPQVVRDIRAGADEPTYYRGFEGP